MKQTSWRNPPSTGYTRPAERKFYVWQDRFITYSPRDVARGKRGKHPWRWLCTMCDPPSTGFRCRPGAHRDIMTVTLPRHMFVRRYHHKIVSMR